MNMKPFGGRPIGNHDCGMGGNFAGIDETWNLVTTGVKENCFHSTIQ